MRRGTPSHERWRRTLAFAARRCLPSPGAVVSLSSSSRASSRRPRVRVALAAVTALVLLAACGSPAPDTVPATLEGERYAHALLNAPTRKPCRATACSTVRRSTLLAAGDTTYVEALVGRDSVLRRWPVRVGQPIRVWVE